MVTHLLPPDPVLDKLERTFAKHRASLLETDAGRWAVFAQPDDRRRRAVLIGCFDVRDEARKAGYFNDVGHRFIVKEVLKKDRVISVMGGISVHRG